MKGVARILIIYTVQTGDTLTEIADRYNVSRAELIEANQLNYPDRLVVGQALVIPAVVRIPIRYCVGKLCSSLRKSTA